MDAAKPNDNQPSSPIDARRRSSGTLFQTLTDKRDNTANAARRQSLHDQRPTPGVFGQMWHNFTRGGSSSPPQ